MEIVEVSRKIKCLIEMALKGEISWFNLGLLIDGLTPTLARSREIIRILLKELENYQSSCLVMYPKDEHVLDIDEDNSNVNEEILEGDSKENGFELVDER